MAVEQEQLHESAIRFLGTDRVATATSADAVDGVQPSVVVAPASIDEAAKALGWAGEADLRVVPRGGGSKMGWGNVPAAFQLILSSRRLNQVIEHAAADMTVAVQAGLTLRELQQVLAEAGQMLALDPPFAERATIGGLISTNDSGPLRLRHGGIRDQLIGVTLVRADGVVVRGGGKVVKNVAGYDLPKLATGSLGTLGVIVEAIFRLYPLPDHSRTLLVQATSVEDACASMLELVDSPLDLSGLAIRWTGGPGCEVFLRVSGVTASISAHSQQAEQVIAQLGLESQTLGATEADTAWRDLVEGPWSPAEQALVARVSVLPTEIRALLLSLREIAERADLQATAVVYAHGLGVVRLEAPGSSGNRMVSAAEELRQRISGRDGTLAVLRVPLEAKRGLDVWGPEPDSLPLMRRIKTQLDPKDTLNPGRFLGGI